MKFSKKYWWQKYKKVIHPIVERFFVLLEAGGENVAIGNHFAIMMNAQQLTSSSIHLGNGLYTLCTLVRIVVCSTLEPEPF
jgi:hypothetical protein